MYEELSALNLWVDSQDPAFIVKNKLDASHFMLLGYMYEYVSNFANTYKKLPTHQTLSIEFEDYKQVEKPEPISYIVTSLNEKKIYTQFRPVLTKQVELMGEGKTIESMQAMRLSIDKLLAENSVGGSSVYSWTQDALERYERLLDKQNNPDSKGIPTGINGLDELTGGWFQEDLIALQARTNSGKSLIGAHFVFNAWKHVKLLGLNQPVVLFSTEMPAYEVAYRLDTMKGHFSNTALSQGKLKELDLYKEFLEELKSGKNNLMIFDIESNNGKPFNQNDVIRVMQSENPYFCCIDLITDLVDINGERDIRKKIVNVTLDVRAANLATKTPTLIVAQSTRESGKNMKKDKNATPDLEDVGESDILVTKPTKVISLRMIDDNMFKMTLKKARGSKKMVDFLLRGDIDTWRLEEIAPETAVF